MNDNLNIHINQEEITFISIKYIADLILCDKINLWDVPFNLRTLSRSMYINSFRKYRYLENSTDRRLYKKTTNILKKDINALNNSYLIKPLIKIYEQYKLEESAVVLHHKKNNIWSEMG